MNNLKTYVWSFLGRLSHWLIVISFFSCYITSFYENLLTLHVVLGIVVFNMLFLKIIWGVIGPRYARWTDFKFSIEDLKYYFVEKVENRYREIPAGHNPASSWFAFLVTWIGIICCIAGFILYGVQEGSGIFSYLNENYYMHMSFISDIHIIIVYVLIVMICTHITGVLIEQFYHKTNMVMAMVTGYKKAKGLNINTTFRMNFLASLYVIFTCFFATYIYYTDNNIFVKSKFEKIDYKVLHKDFYFECSDCHNLIPPELLPKSSWIALMNKQDNHYDEDLELDKDLVKSIKTFLVNNSSETSSKEAAHKLQEEIKSSKLFTITKTSYWKSTHKDISKEIFKSDEIESKTNCMACHKDFEKGILSDINITYLNKKIIL